MDQKVKFTYNQGAVSVVFRGTHSVASVCGSKEDAESYMNYLAKHFDGNANTIGLIHALEKHISNKKKVA